MFNQFGCYIEDFIIAVNFGVMHFKNSNFIGGPNPLNNINLDSLIIINPLITVEELQELNYSMSNTILFMAKKIRCQVFSTQAAHLRHLRDF